MPNRAALFAPLFWVASVAAALLAAPQSPPVPAALAPAASPTTVQATVNQYCVSCHNDRLKTAGLSLQNADFTRVGEQAEVWERVVRKMRGSMMPPVGMPRP